MSASLVGSPIELEVSTDDLTDEQLVKQCLGQNQEAWSRLLQKYSRLIHSIPVKYGASPEDGADIFQAVALDLYSDLSKLREPRALRAWLMQVTSRKCLQWKLAQKRRAEDDLSEIEFNLPDALITTPALLEHAEEKQRLQAAISCLPERFRHLILMLYFEQPPRSYKQAAETLGVAPGSIAFLRARCLRRLQRILEEMETSRIKYQGSSFKNEGGKGKG